MGSVKRKAAFLVLAMSLLGPATGFAAKWQEPVSNPIPGLTSIAVQGMEEHWAKRLFQWGISETIIDGYLDGGYRPDCEVTEAEFIKMLFRGTGMALPDANYHYPLNELHPSLYPSSEEWNWKKGIYLMADVYNIPTVGKADDSNGDKPITKLQAAEIISAAQGVSFTGDNAVAYLIGQGLANSIAISPEEFDGTHTLTRAEALQWLRQMAIHNKLDLHKRPEEPSDISLIEAPLTKINPMPDFSSELVTAKDFNLLGSNDFGVRWGESKENIVERFGESMDLDTFNYEIYPLFSVYYTSNGLLDGWKVYLEEMDITALTPSLRTNKGIVLGESSYSDVISKYGTAGVNRESILTYYYEIAPDGTYRDLSIFDTIQNPDQSFALSFLIDDETGKVIRISASSLRTAFKLF